MSDYDDDSDETASNLHDLFEKQEDVYHKFEDIPVKDRLHPSRTLCGFLKLASLLKHPERFDIQGEHDILYLAHEDSLKPLTEDDVIYLQRCGIHYDNHLGCLAAFS